MGLLDSIHTSTWLGTVTLLFFLYPIGLWTYNLLFHPLAKFPGPPLWRASRLPYMHAVWSARYPYIVRELHKKFGDVVRTAPGELSFASAAAWDDIYSNRAGANSEAFRKSEIWHGNPDGGPSSVFVTIDPKKHARIRRLLDPAFSERATLQQEPILQEYANLCIAKLCARLSNGRTTVNICDWLNFFLFDTIGDLSFGESFGCLEKCEHEPWMTQMAAAIKLHYISINLRYYPIVTALLKPFSSWLVPPDLVAQQMDYHKRSTAKLNRRLATDTGRPDIVSQLLNSDDGKDRLTPEEIRLNCMLFINAASETTATTLTGAVNNLLQDPASLSKLQDEIRQFSLPSELTLAALKQLPYLDGVLKEALRMCNPNPIGHMRISPPQGGIIAGHFVPGNTLVTAHDLTLSFSPDNFHEPNMWRPERWLSEVKVNPNSPYHNDNWKAVRAFGWGPANCVGEPLAWAWMRLILARLVWTFNIEEANTANSKLVWDKQEVWAIVIKDRLDITLAERAP